MRLKALGFQSTQMFGFFLRQLPVMFFFTSTLLMQLNRLLRDQQYEISCLNRFFGVVAFLFFYFVTSLHVICPACIGQNIV